MGLRIIAVDDIAAIASTAADLVVDAIGGARGGSFVAATGATPMPTYAELARRARAGALDPLALRVFQLDDYLGVERTDRRSLTGWFDRSVVEPLGVGNDGVVRLDGMAADLDAECRRYDGSVATNGLDLAILGLGPNGHLGFNEPPSTPDAPTRVVALTAESVRSNAAYWGSEADVPTHAITAGMAQLLSAGRVLLLVVGARKRDILTAVLDGPVTDDVPASYLQRHHDAIVVADPGALGR